MSDDDFDLPKYRLRKRTPPEDVPRAVEPEPVPKEPLGFRKPQTYKSQDDMMSNTAEILEDAYGKLTRKQRRQARKRRIISVLAMVGFVCVAILATLGYAHVVKGWPLLSPFSWYLPFFLSALISVLWCYKSIKFWKGGDHLLSVAGLLLAGILAYWNLFLLEYATEGDRIMPSNAFWAPASTNDLYLSSEFNRLRGVPNSLEAYTELTTAQHRRAFNTISSEEWKPYFRRYLSPEEMDRLSVANLQTDMHVVVDRIQAQRRETWLALEEELEDPSVGLWCLKVFIEPYTLSIKYLSPLFL